MKPGESCRVGDVCDVTNNRIFVRLLSGDKTGQCAGCALAFSCNASSDSEAVVEVDCGNSLLHRVIEGTRVKVCMDSTAPVYATMLLFVFPLAVFLLLAVVLTILSVGQGVVGIASLLSAALSFFVVKRVAHRRKSVWHIVEIVKETNQ